MSIAIAENGLNSGQPEKTYLQKRYYSAEQIILILNFNNLKFDIISRNVEMFVDTYLSPQEVNCLMQFMILFDMDLYPNNRELVCSTAVSTVFQLFTFKKIQVQITA